MIPTPRAVCPVVSRDVFCANPQRSRRPAAPLGLLLALLLPAAPALAQDLSPVATMLGTVQAALTGPIGQAIVTIAIIGVGYACFLGRVQWILFAMVLVGAVLVFYADDLVDGFA